MQIPDTVIDRAHRKSNTYVEYKSKISCKSVIVHVTSFRHKNMVYRTKKNMRNNVRVRPNLTKKALQLFLQTNLLKIYNQLNFVTQM